MFFITKFKKKIVKISVGHTPDSDDAFMFYAMFTDLVKSEDFVVGSNNFDDSRAITFLTGLGE